MCLDVSSAYEYARSAALDGVPPIDVCFGQRFDAYSAHTRIA
jgi:hypothetical protein